MTDEQTTQPVQESQERTRRLLAGGILVIAGLGLLALQALDELGDAGVLFVIGTVFIAAYAMRRAYGLLVAGSIILGVGLGQLGEQLLDVSGDVNVIGIGIGFVMIFVVDRLTDGSAHWWPLIPGGILLVIGLSSIGGSFADIAALFWPALLIIAGLVLVVGASRRRT
jgi:hypothetical protein